MNKTFVTTLEFYRSTFGFALATGLAVAVSFFILLFPYNAIEALVFFRMEPMVANAWLATLVSSLLITFLFWPQLEKYRWFILTLGTVIYLLGEVVEPYATFRLTLTMVMLATLIYVVTQNMRRPNWLPDVFLGPWPLITIFAILTSLRSIARHELFDSHAFDLGIFTQTLYKYAHADGLFITIRGLNSLGDHFAPVLVLISPLWWIWQDARLLLVIQAVVVALGAYPAYQLTYQRFRSRFLALAIALAYLLAPGIQALVKFDFHEVAFAATGLLYLAYFGFNRRWTAYWVTFILCLMIKENLPVYLAAWSVYFWVRSKNWRVSLTGIGIAVLWYLATMKLIIPYFSHIPAGSYQYFDFPELGQTPEEAIRTIVVNPIYTANIFLHPAIKQETLAIMSAGLGWTWLLAPWSWVAAFPMLFEQFLYNLPSHWNLLFHYAAAITAPMILGTLDGLDWLTTQVSRFKTLWGGNRKYFLRWFAIFLVISTLGLSVTHRLFLTDLLRPSFYRATPERQAIADTHTLFERIPTTASVVASHAIVPHLAGRSDIIAWPPVRPEPSLHDLHAEWAIFNLAGSTWPKNRDEQKALIREFIADERYGLVATAGGTALFARNEPDNPELVANWEAAATQF